MKKRPVKTLEVALLFDMTVGAYDESTNPSNGWRDVESSLLDTIPARMSEVCDAIGKMSFSDKVHAINEARRMLHLISPFASEPVDCVQWISAESVVANDYNPNSVAPPEMKLLEHSIQEDGYTQPIVSWNRDSVYEVVDGFHRHRVGKESKVVNKRVNGYLPLVVINGSRQDLTDRMASTIRHNRARGKHRVEGMSDIVVELKRRNWTNERIARELGMDEDEILRLCQITGLAELFTDQEFSNSWDVEGEITEDDFEGLTDDVTTYGEQAQLFRTVNTSDDSRVFHTFDKWECYKAGFYNSFREGMNKDQCEEAFRSLISDRVKFEAALSGVITGWPNSCEHYLTNVAMNRIAWLGQAAVCFATGVPQSFRGGWSLLTEEEKNNADGLALVYLNKWMDSKGRLPLSMEEARTDRQSVIY